MLTIDRVCKSFGSLSVLKDVSLTVGDGEIVALIGPSGCEKQRCWILFPGFLSRTAEP